MDGGRVLLSLVFFGIVVGCSDVGFQAVPSKTCVAFNNGGDQECDFNPQGNTYAVTFKTGQIDILVVNDNSRSMSPEHRKMADAFSGFLSTISHLDYRIAMITTDAGKEQGRLLEFKDEQGNGTGEKFLTKNTTNLDSKFRGTIVRKETLACDAGTAACPGDDERGIYAANLALERNENSWLRPGAHLAIIALADEDQRSGTQFVNNEWVGINRGDPLQDVDFPETLVETFANKYSSKSLSFHSVIVVPGDTTCYNQQLVLLQNGYYLRGSYGNLYQQLSQAQQNQLDDLGQIVNGSVVSICNSTYYSSLNLIGSLASTNADEHSIQMQCLPDLEDISVEASQSVDYTVDPATRKINFQNLPFGVQVKVTWVCPNSV
jgi:hypothetical protein